MANELATNRIIPFINSAAPGRRKGATATIVNEATGGRVTLRFRKPRMSSADIRKGRDEATLPVFIDVMDGCDNNINFSFVGTLRGASLAISRKAKARADKASRAKTVLDWTLAAVEADDLRTVRVLHEGVCGRCGRKLTVPESIDTGLGPVCGERR
jgi:tRNA A37 methylthiotransferase MiaB